MSAIFRTVKPSRSGLAPYSADAGKHQGTTARPSAPRFFQGRDGSVHHLGEIAGAPHLAHGPPARLQGPVDASGDASRGELPRKRPIAPTRVEDARTRPGRQRLEQGRAEDRNKTGIALC
jgi:hypothetical protein